MSAMKSRKRAVLYVVTGGLLCLGAYVSAGYILNPAVVDQGGGVANSSNYEIRASVGGPVVAAGGGGAGEASSAGYRMEVSSVSMLDAGAAPPPTGGGGDDDGCTPGAGGPGALALLLPAFLAYLAVRRGGRREERRT